MIMGFFHRLIDNLLFVKEIFIHDCISEPYKETLMQHVKGVRPVAVVGYMSAETQVENTRRQHKSVK